MLAWKSQKPGFDEEKRAIRRKLEATERELEELRRVRREDSKANEKVGGTFAAQEQRWFNERRKLQQHIGSLVREVKGHVSELNGKIKEHEKNLDTTHGDSRSKGRTKELEILQEETFQLQRYMVSTGQKMMEIWSTVSNGFVGVAEQVDKSVDIDTKLFCEGLRTLFRDVQGVSRFESRGSLATSKAENDAAADELVKCWFGTEGAQKKKFRAQDW